MLNLEYNNNCHEDIDTIADGDRPTTKGALTMKLFNEHIITIGMFDQETKKQEITKEDYIRIIEDEICKRDLCATLFTQGIFGIYRHEDGTVVKEPSIRIEIAGVERSAIIPMVRHFREVFNQESVLYKMTAQEFDLVDINYGDDD